MVNEKVNIEFKMVKKEAVKDMIESQTFGLPNRKAFDQKLRELRQENYVLTFDKVK